MDFIEKIIGSIPFLSENKFRDGSFRKRFHEFWISYITGYSVSLLIVVTSFILVSMGFDISEGSAPVGCIIVFWGGGYLIRLYMKTLSLLKDDEIRTQTNILYFKEYIQVQGYLQTLISFLIVIISFGGIDKDEADTTSDITNIAFPIALALITSILGWGLGNELINEYEKEEDLDQKIKKLGLNIELLGSTLDELNTKYKVSALAFIESMNTLTGTQKAANVDYLESIKKLKENHQIFQTSFKSSLKDVEKNLDQMNNVIAEKLEVIVDSSATKISEIKVNTEDNILSLTEHVKGSFDNATSDLKEMNTELKKIVDNKQNENNKFELKFNKMIQNLDENTDQLNQLNKNFLDFLSNSNNEKE